MYANEADIIRIRTLQVKSADEESVIYEVNYIRHKIRFIMFYPLYPRFYYQKCMAQKNSDKIYHPVRVLIY
jgi:hypothetical protein